jgi:hypothetical protein
MSDVTGSNESGQGKPAFTEAPAPAEIELTIGEHKHKLRYEQAFALACRLVESGRLDDASKLFDRLEEFTDRGPRAFIMHAFCESAAKHFDVSKDRLDAAFDAEKAQLAAEINDAFVYYHVAGREEGIRMIAELVDKHDTLPTLCLLLGNMLRSRGDAALAKRCWSLAIHRDRPGGAVGAVAMHYLRHVDD